MKILHIAPIGHHAEGIGSVLNKLVPLQKTLGEDVRIISLYKNNTYKDLPITTITDSESFKKFIVTWTPDIVIIHSVFKPLYGKFNCVLDNMRIPYIIQLHGALSYENFRKNNLKKRIALFLWIRRLIKHAKSIIYLNEAEYKNSIVPKINPNYTILPNGCDQIGSLDAEKYTDGDIEIVFIGRIAYTHKGLDILLEAVRQLEAQNATGFHITIYGNEDDIDVTRLKNDTANLRLISYAGSVYGERKREVLSSSDLFILTSRYEGMPMGVLEALSYGVPCILTPGTNMAEDIANAGAGWITDFSPESVAETILQAIFDIKNNQNKCQLSAFELSKQFDWNVIAKRSIKIYKNLI